MRYLAAAAAALALAACAWILHGDPAYGREFSFDLIAGAAFGFILQRSRFCFAAAFRDLFLLRDRRVAMGLLAALAAGSAGYVVIFGAQIPDPTAGYPPPTAHIAPAGWHLLLGGVSFGVGMVLAGGCISGNLYRLGEGSLVAPAALIGVGLGYWCGFALWNFLWVNAVATAPVVWLPDALGYAGALALQLGALAALAALLLRALPPPPPRPAEPATLRSVLGRVFSGSWPAPLGGLLIGVLGTFVFLRTGPLGVTSEIGRLSRKLGTSLGLVTERLEGLDRLAGCRPILADDWITRNGVFVAALVAGSLLGALLAGEFRPRAGRPRAYLTALAGGVLLGFGAMVSLGCTVGTLLSGIMAFSLSGWLFALGLLAGAWAGGAVLRRLA